MYFLRATSVLGSVLYSIVEGEKIICAPALFLVDGLIPLLLALI